MTGPMPMDELRRHRRTISEFLAMWGYHLPHGMILPAQFKHGYGLKIDFPQSMAITDLPNRDGKTNEYFLRQCLEAAHESLWKEVRQEELDKNSKNKNLGMKPGAHVPTAREYRVAKRNEELRHWDGTTLTHWAAELMNDEPDAITGEFTPKEHDFRCGIQFTGRVSGQTNSLQIDGDEIKITARLPDTVIQSIRMQPLGELFGDFPLTRNAALNDRVLGLYVMKAQVIGEQIIFTLLDGLMKPMPSANQDDLWRRIRARAPDTVLLQFPPYVEMSDVHRRADEHRAVIEPLIQELPLQQREQYTPLSRRAA